MGGRAGACDSLRCLSACLFLTVHLHRWVHFVHSVFVGRRVRHLCETSSTHPAANNTSTSRYLVLTCHRGISQVDKDDSVSLRYNGSYLDLACHLPRPPPSPCPRRPSTECNCTHEIKKQSMGGTGRARDGTAHLGSLSRQMGCMFRVSRLHHYRTGSKTRSETRENKYRSTDIYVQRMCNLSEPPSH
ncbi:hypothetical protein IWX50DRAFT_134267 [Phyllosticta citricarpa]